MRAWLLGIIIIVLVANAGMASAEDAWVMCNPKSYVTIREKPNKHSKETGYGYAGDKVELTGKKSGRWYQIDTPCENGEGWIRGDYLSFTEPEIFHEGRWFEVTRNKTFVRYSIRGNEREKLKKGARVCVWVWSAEWCVTSRGYIATEFLQEVPDER